MAVYGDQLAFFPELFQMFDNYSLKPLAVAGKHERVFIQKVRGIKQDMKAGELDVEGDTLNATSVPTFWTRTPLKRGTYLVDPAFPDELYIVNKENNFKFQGNFIVYILENQVASTDKQETNHDFNYGMNNYD